MIFVTLCKKLWYWITEEPVMAPKVANASHVPIGHKLPEINAPEEPTIFRRV